MKSFFYTSLLVLSAVAVGNAQSLYSVASPVGLEGTVPLKYRAKLSFGYDDNVNAVPDNYRSHQESSYARLSVGASKSNWDARTQYSFDVSLGAILYFESMSFGSKDVMSDTTLRGSLVHNLDSTLRYTATVGVSYMPEPDYSLGINMGSRAGEYLQAFFDNAISKAWNERFSTSTGFNLVTIQYLDSDADIDNRDYYRITQNFRYKWTPRSAVSLNLKGEYADRRYGSDARSLFLFGGWEYALTEHTNITLQAGPQFKRTFDGTDTYVFAMAGLNHKLTDRAAVSFFFRHEDESTNTYQSRRNYASNSVYRAGVMGSYKLNHVWTASLGANLINCDYTNGQDGLRDKDSTVYNFTAGLAYDVTPNLSLNLTYSYTHGKNGNFYTDGTADGKYDRNIYAIGATYTF